MRFFISTGEASGEYHGAALARALRDRVPGCEIRGIGGTRMKAAGVDLLADIGEMNVMGVVELLPRLRRILQIKREAAETIRRWKPDAVIFIDAPDFNLRLAETVREAGIRTIYFIPPKLWAWRAGRVRKIRALIEQLLVIFPFETRFYAEHGVTAEFIGNPLLDDCKGPARPDPDAAPVIGVVPGSRRSEVTGLLPPMLEAVQRVRAEYPEARFLLPVASTVDRTMLQPAVEAGVALDDRPLPAVMADCDFAWVASGTAALETALAEVPMAVVYRLHPLTLAIAKRLVKLSHFSLPNILAGREVVPELLQNEVNGPQLADYALTILGDAGRRAEVHADLRALRTSLGEPGAADRAAAAILNALPSRR